MEEESPLWLKFKGGFSRQISIAFAERFKPNLKPVQSFPRGTFSSRNPACPPSRAACERAKPGRINHLARGGTYRDPRGRETHGRAHTAHRHTAQE